MFKALLVNWNVPVALPIAVVPVPVVFKVDAVPVKAKDPAEVTESVPEVVVDSVNGPEATVVVKPPVLGPVMVLAVVPLKVKPPPRVVRPEPVNVKVGLLVVLPKVIPVPVVPLKTPRVEAVCSDNAPPEVLPIVVAAEPEVLIEVAPVKPIVVPVGISGFWRAFNKTGLKFKKKGTQLSVTFKEPLQIDYDAPAEDILKQVMDAIEQSKEYMMKGGHQIAKAKQL